MIDIEIKSDGDPDVLAEMIKSTLHGHIVEDPESELAAVGKFVRDQQELAEQERPSHDELSTVNFSKLDDETDFSDL